MKVLPLCLLPVIMFVSGCATPIGLFSYLATSHNETARVKRSITLSQKIVAEKKPQILKAIEFNMRPGEVAFGAGIDMMELFSSDYTLGEKTLTTGGDILDLGTYAGIITAILKNINNSSSHESHTTVSVTGNDNDVNTNGKGNQNTTTDRSSKSETK